MNGRAGLAGGEGMEVGRGTETMLTVQKSPLVHSCFPAVNLAASPVGKGLYWLPGRY